MNEDLLRDLAQYKNYKERSVMMAARSLIHLYRSSMPELLHKKDRVCTLITWFDRQVRYCYAVCCMWDIFLTVISEIVSATHYLISKWLTHKIYLISVILKPASNRINFCLLLCRHICIFWLHNSSMSSSLSVFCVLPFLTRSFVSCWFFLFVCPCVHEKNIFSNPH